ncbi:unnamed protein product [Gordionus sp. m RMFG-2023]
MTNLTDYKFSYIFLWHPALNIGLANSSENFSCIPLSVMYNNKKSLFWFFITIAPIVCVMGLLGNALGLKIALKEKFQPNVLLTRALYLANVFNCLIMLIYPILDLIGELKFLNFWFKISWNRYMADYHFPIAKSFVNFSFGIYVTLALSQLMGIAFPFKYKIWFRTKNIVYMLVFNFIYVVLWSIPFRWRFNTNSINVCGVNPVYYYKFSDPDSKQALFSWTTYEVTREVFTKFIPALVILLFKVWTNKMRKLLLVHRINHSSNASLNRLISSGRFPKFCRKSRVSDMPINLEFNMERQPESSRKAPVIQNPNIQARLRDYEVENKLIGILGIEFIVFLFPVSIFLICRNYIPTGNDYEIDIAFAFCTLMEYLYISLTFYLNLAFNPRYREAYLRNPLGWQIT